MGTGLPALTRLLFVVLVGVCACTGGGSAGSTSPGHGCRSDPPLAGVWSPDRLQVLSACKHVTGIVAVTQPEPDGDHHIWLRVDPGYEYLLNAENHFQAEPALLAEITPDCPLATNPPNAESADRCPRSTLPLPRTGDHIAIDGPWVLDTEHGWNEIHPVESIQILGHV